MREGYVNRVEEYVKMKNVNRWTGPSDLKIHIHKELKVFNSWLRVINIFQELICMKAYKINLWYTSRLDILRATTPR